MNVLPTKTHKIATFTIPLDMPIAEAIALTGNEAILPGDTYSYLEALQAPTRRVGSAWFMCPVTAEWLPVTQGVKYQGGLYSPDAAADLRIDRKGKKSAPPAMNHWSDDGSVRQ